MPFRERNEEPRAPARRYPDSTEGLRPAKGKRSTDDGPQGWVRRLGEGDRPALACGYWHVTPEEAPEPFDLVIHADESISIVEGHLRIEVEGGDVYDLKAGGAASFNKGARTRWAVLAPTVEFFVYS